MVVASLGAVHLQGCRKKNLSAFSKIAAGDKIACSPVPLHFTSTLNACTSKLERGTEYNTEYNTTTFHEECKVQLQNKHNLFVLQVEDGMFLSLRSLYLSMLSNTVATSTQPNKRNGIVSEEKKTN